MYKESVQQKKKKKTKDSICFWRALLILCNHMLVLRPIQMKVSFLYFYEEIRFHFVCGLFFLVFFQIS